MAARLKTSSAGNRLPEVRATDLPHRHRSAGVSSPAHALLDLVEEIVLPALRSNSGGIVPSESAITTETGPFSEAYPYTNHSHSYFEWFWLLSNSAHMKIDDRVYQLRAGDFCFLPPETCHADLFTGRSPDFGSLWFSYQGNILHSYIFAYEPVGSWRMENHHASPAPDGLESLLLKLKSELNGDNLYKEDSQRGLLMQLGICLARRLQQDLRCATPNLRGQVSHRVLGYLEKCHNQEITLQDIARIAYLSPDYMASLFKRETGHTVFEALTEIRLRHAKRLLLEGTLPAQAIAKAVGYRDASHFSHVFARNIGVSPSRYRKL